jgi:hypothetical protein
VVDDGSHEHRRDGDRVVPGGALDGAVADDADTEVGVR